MSELFLACFFAILLHKYGEIQNKLHARDSQQLIGPIILELLLFFFLQLHTFLYKKPEGDLTTFW